jgi:hypothetical protein
MVRPGIVGNCRERDKRGGEKCGRDDKVLHGLPFGVGQLNNVAVRKLSPAWVSVFLTWAEAVHSFAVAGYETMKIRTFVTH